MSEDGWITAEELLDQQYPDPGLQSVLDDIETRLRLAVNGTPRSVEIEGAVYKGLTGYMRKLNRVAKLHDEGQDEMAARLEAMPLNKAQACFAEVFEHLRNRGFALSFEPEGAVMATSLEIRW